MTETIKSSLQGVPSASNSNACNATESNIVPKLELRCELDRGPDVPLIPPDVPRRARKLRVAASIAALLAVLCIGWGAGLKTQELVQLDEVSIWVRGTARALVSDLETQSKKIMSDIGGLASASASQPRSSPPPKEINTGAVIETSENKLGIKLDLLRVSSATLISQIDQGFDRLSASAERSQKELLAKLDQLQNRLEQVEHQLSDFSGMSRVQLSERTAAAQQPATPAPPLPTLVPSGPPKSQTTTAQIKRIENWAVTDVVDGMAILAGPRGIIGVSSGDVVPGVGRVESISRRAGKWIVATSKGVITE